MKIMYVHRKLDDNSKFINDMGIYDHYLYHQSLSPYSMTVDFFPFLSKKKILFQNLSSKANDYDIVHSSGHFIPIVKNKPLIVTLPDASPFLFPSEKFSFVLKRLLKHHIQYADHFIASHPAIIPELKKYWRINEKKISIVPPGLDPAWYDRLNQTTKSNILEKYRIPPNYFLCVGQIDPRKNLSILLDAFNQLPEKTKNKHHLVIIGDVLFDNHTKTGLHVELASQFKHIHWIRTISFKDLQAFFQSALGYFHLSTVENYHFHLLSAYASRIPVIAVTNDYSLSYIKDNAYLLNKIDRHTIYESMFNLVEEPISFSSFMDAGFQFTQQFSWNHSLQETIKVFNKII